MRQAWGGGIRNAYILSAEKNLNGRDVGDLGVDLRIILKWIIKIRCRRVGLEGRGWNGDSIPLMDLPVP